MYTTLEVTVKDGVQTIRFNRPRRRNAINSDMYNEVIRALNEGAENENVVVTVLTGAGEYYSSGNDIGSYFQTSQSDMMATVKEAINRVEQFVRAFVEFPKILIALVNGPCFGIATTTLALCDSVYASETATFITPFTSLGLVPEGCSSYTFPKLMGTLKAAEMLYYNRKLSAAEAVESGLVTEVYTDAQQIWEKIFSIAQLPTKSLIFAKRLVRSQDRAALMEANRLECKQLLERWQSEDSMNAVMKFMSRKSNL